ncbi:MAG: 3-oxoacyl-[acyl-carrier protein] reductase [Myxococcales bacterium]|nr:3-oxoacyl-[acyl-carrier protein] reductase [Myxococcales bacterium]
MSDWLLQLGAHPQARRITKTLGLPLPLPQTLRRARGPWEARPLADRVVVMGGLTGAQPLVADVFGTVVAAGANPHVVGMPSPALVDLGSAYGRPPTSLALEALPDGLRPDALVFDATAVADSRGLRALYDFFHPLVGALAANGRLVVFGRPPSAASSPEGAAAQAALEGFVRSVAKEIGRRGSTAQLVIVEPGAEGRVSALLRFLLSPRSAFVTGQPIAVDGRAAAPAEPPATVRVLEGKVALVTGAARGIGEATARLLAGEGAHVVCVDRPADAGAVSQLARTIDGSVVLADITAADAPAAIVSHLAERGGVDVVVHNAGITRDKTLGRMSAEAWSSVIDVNLDAIVRIDAALDDAQARPAGAGTRSGPWLRPFGREICLASVAGIAGNVGQSNYAASKAGVAAYVRRRAVDLAPRGITVNGVAPGFIETRMTAAIPLLIREAGRRLSALGQGGLPSDVGEVITFLASPGAVGITGAVLRVCGGALIGA